MLEPVGVGQMDFFEGRVAYARYLHGTTKFEAFMARFTPTEREKIEAALAQDRETS